VRSDQFFQNQKDKLDSLFYSLILTNKPTIDYSTSLSLNKFEQHLFEVKFYRASKNLDNAEYYHSGLNRPLLHIDPQHFGLTNSGPLNASSLDYCLTSQPAFRKFFLYTQDTPFYVPQGSSQKLTLLTLLKETFMVHQCLKLQKDLINSIK
jgi:hypothetical protein